MFIFRFIWILHKIVHGMVTNFYGNKCGALAGEPYIINCDYDLAGKILQFIYQNTLKPALVLMLYCIIM